jgi:hypothetical protein
MQMSLVFDKADSDCPIIASVITGGQRDPRCGECGVCEGGEKARRGVRPACAKLPAARRHDMFVPACAGHGLYRMGPCVSWRLHGAGEAEAPVVVPVVRVVVVPVGGTAVPGVVVPAPAPFHAVRPRSRTFSGCPILLSLRIPLNPNQRTPPSAATAQACRRASSISSFAHARS